MLAAYAVIIIIARIAYYLIYYLYRNFTWFIPLFPSIVSLFLLNVTSNVILSYLIDVNLNLSNTKLVPFSKENKEKENYKTQDRSSEKEI